MEVSILSRREVIIKIAAVTVASIIFISSVAIIDIVVNSNSKSKPSSSGLNKSFQSRPCKVKSILSQHTNRSWTTYVSSANGTRANANVTISDTSGITIVANFPGFWRSTVSINGTLYDHLEMPGASSTYIPGTPMVPCLYKYIEVPHDVNVSVEVLSSVSINTSGYSIRPTPPPIIPIAQGEPNLNASPQLFEQTYFDTIYLNDTFFPGNSTSLEGGSNATKIVMRGHRLVGLSFYPVQYNNISNILTVYSQLTVKLNYSVPAQILPIGDSLYSDAFERILSNTLLNYDSSSSPYTTLLGSTSTTLAQDSQPGAEYLIITNRDFISPADRLAKWKERKGVPSAIMTVEELTQDALRAEVKGKISNAYSNWNPAPTYVVLLGDVKIIPANYDADFEGNVRFSTPLFHDISDHGNIASDLGYFNIDGYDYIPDMIYGRISVDTVEQADIIVDKIIQYEKSPPEEETFYNNMLTAGYFQDYDRRDGVEDANFPFIYTLERIRHYLKDNYGYSIHVNYSCAWEAYISEDWDRTDYNIKLKDLMFQDVLDATDSVYLADSLDADSIPHEFKWLKGYDGDPLYYYEPARKNITANFIDGRFLILYYGHGGSRNMIYPIDITWPCDDGDKRDLVEGWHQPYYNTSYFSDLTNGHQTPVIISIACSNGWFDGETDEQFLNFIGGVSNPFEDVESDCFAENITRIANGGAVAIIAPSRPAHSIIGGHLLDGIVQALYPGHLESENEPIYELGAALLYGKLYSATQWTGEGILQWFDWLLHPEHIIRTTFEEYHLFGDPELRLWTEIPTELTVAYPQSLETSNSQQLTVTVSNKSALISFAKVCIQQMREVNPIYEVGYTDARGQVTFELPPSTEPSHINVTVTKHNFIPHIGEIYCYYSPITTTTTTTTIPTTPTSTTTTTTPTSIPTTPPGVETYYGWLILIIAFMAIVCYIVTRKK